MIRSKQKKLSFLLMSLILSHQTLYAAENMVNHYIEANVAANYIFTGGDRLDNTSVFAQGFHIAHGSNITAVHALVLSIGKDYFANSDAKLDSKAFYLRRYMPNISKPNYLFYSTIGSAYYQYQKSGTSGVLENAGIIIGFGADFKLTDKLMLALESNYRGFMIRQFGNKDSDYIRPFTLFAGFKYYYRSTKY